MEKYDFDETPELTDDEQTPFSERQISTDNSNPTIETLCARHARGKLDLQPSFQRNYVWDIKKASRLIESVLLGVPLPIIYLSEEANGSTCVIDGQQRLTSFLAFFSGGFPDKRPFKLTGLNILTELNGQGFKELSDEQQEKFLAYAIPVVTFKKESDQNLKFEIFERLNTGSAQLNDQELRNCIYRGELNELLKKLSQYKEFKELMGFDEPKTRMEDCEWVLRFCAFYYFTTEKYKPSMKNFMNQMAREGRNLSENQLQEIETAFKNACQMAKSIFGDHAFKRYYAGESQTQQNGRWESKRFNASLYDIVLNSFARRKKNSLMRHADAIREALIDLMVSDSEFNQAITASTSSEKHVKLRFRKWNDALDAILMNETDEPRTFSFQLKKQMWDSNPTCSICGNQILSVDDAALDHIEQYWRGGKTVPENARLAHRFCNNSRSRKD